MGRRTLNVEVFKGPGATLEKEGGRGGEKEGGGKDVRFVTCLAIRFTAR
ncbi:unnamed protein product [Strongylus vulgaris]|uniref:Uncharacterized protein n=1 Tax=Strongylus vulgaris TaxID=40348 RepID=A0A3P7J170_STRVU|nr:unnamed protein product [Strongylus vulgaris]